MCGSHIFLIAMRGIKILWVVSIFFSFNAQLFWTYTRCTDNLMSCLTGVFVFLHVFLPATVFCACMPHASLTLVHAKRR